MEQKEQKEQKNLKLFKLRTETLIKKMLTIPDEKIYNMSDEGLMNMINITLCEKLYPLNLSDEVIKKFKPDINLSQDKDKISLDLLPIFQKYLNEASEFFLKNHNLKITNSELTLI